MLINTVDEYKVKSCHLTSHNPKRARTLKIRIERPTVRDYIHCVSMNMIPHCPFAMQDILNIEFIWSPDLGCVKGKIVRYMSPKLRVENVSTLVSVMQQ